MLNERPVVLNLGGPHRETLSGVRTSLRAARGGAAVNPELWNQVKGVRQVKSYYERGRAVYVVETLDRGAAESHKVGEVYGLRFEPSDLRSDEPRPPLDDGEGYVVVGHLPLMGWREVSAYQVVFESVKFLGLPSPWSDASVEAPAGVGVDAAGDPPGRARIAAADPEGLPGMRARHAPPPPGPTKFREFL